MHFNSIDIFCHIIDNFGDAGFVFRFANEFHVAHPDCRVRVFCDDMRTLAKICHQFRVDDFSQEQNGITFVNSTMLSKESVSRLGPADILVEALGCDIPDVYLQENRAATKLWINLEYLSAEPWVGDYHKKQSLLGDGTTNKYFYMPGFTKDTGGVLIDSSIEKIKPDLRENRLKHLEKYCAPFDVHLTTTSQTLFCSIFTYERPFDSLLADFAVASQYVYLFVCGTKSIDSMRATLMRQHAVCVADSHYTKDNITILLMPFLSQHDYDTLLCLMDVNIVRGEDSLVRAICAEKPFLWNAYLQDAKYHCVKVAAFCRMIEIYFDDKTAFDHYQNAMMSFNERALESLDEAANERYDGFLKNLNKIEHAVKSLSYFIARNGSMIDQFSEFIEQY